MIFRNESLFIVCFIEGATKAGFTVQVLHSTVLSPMIHEKKNPAKSFVSFSKGSKEFRIGLFKSYISDENLKVLAEGSVFGRRHRVHYRSK